MMNSPVNLKEWGLNCSVKDKNCEKLYSGDLFIVEKICVVPAIFFGWLGWLIGWFLCLMAYQPL